MKQILTTEHVFICGRTGSGKTFLAKNYLAGYDNVIALDTKGTLIWEQAGEVPIFEHLDDLMNFKEGKAIYRPSFDELDNDHYERFFKWIYYRMNTIVWIDELMSISNTSYIPQYLKAILTRGRERNTSAWCLTQRPKTVPLVTMSEATHFFVFSLNLETDRQRVNEFIGTKDIIDIIPKKYEFWYYNVEAEKPVLAKLVIKK